MEPKGKTKLLIDAMQAQPEKALWTPAECSEITGITKGLSAHLTPAVRREWLFKHDLGSRKVAYSLQPQEQEPEEEPEIPEFNAALWADGDLVLHGVRLNDDGHSVTLDAKQTSLLCRLLHGQGPAE